MVSYCHTKEDFKDPTRKILAMIMDQKIQEKYCAQGRAAGKENFSQTEVFKCLDCEYNKQKFYLLF